MCNKIKFEAKEIARSRRINKYKYVIDVLEKELLGLSLILKLISFVLEREVG